MARLTKTMLDTAKPKEQEYLLWDSEVKGFGARIWPSGVVTFVFKYRVGEKTKRATIGRWGNFTVEKARDEAREMAYAVRKGEDPNATKAAARGDMDVADLMALYLEEGPTWKPNKKASSWYTDEIVVRRHIVPLVGRKVAKRLTSGDVARMQADIAAGKTAAQQKMKKRGLARVTGGSRMGALTVSVLSGAYTFAMRTGRLTTNPCTGVSRVKSVSRERFMSEAEVALIGEALGALEAENHVNSDMAAAIRLLMFTGARKSEITNLRWGFVDLERRLLRLPDSKTGPKVIPLAPPALELLKDRPRTSVHVFPAAWGEGPTVGVPKAWRAVKARANAIARKRAFEAGQRVEDALDVADVRLHDLRHTFASFAVADGASLFVLGRVLGHKNARTTEVYAHLRDDPMLAVADRAAGKFAAALKGQTAEVIPFSKATAYGFGG